PAPARHATGTSAPRRGGPGQEGAARRDVPRDPDRRHRLPDGSQADLLIRRSPSPMPTVATSPTHLLTLIAGSAHLEGERVAIDDEAAFRDAGIRDLAWTAAFSTD